VPAQDMDVVGLEPTDPRGSSSANSRRHWVFFLALSIARNRAWVFRPRLCWGGISLRNFSINDLLARTPQRHAAIVRITSPPHGNDALVSLERAVRGRTSCDYLRADTDTRRGQLSV